MSIPHPRSNHPSYYSQPQHRSVHTHFQAPHPHFSSAGLASAASSAGTDEYSEDEFDDDEDEEDDGAFYSDTDSSPPPLKAQPGTGPPRVAPAPDPPQAHFAPQSQHRAAHHHQQHHQQQHHHHHRHSHTFAHPQHRSAHLQNKPHQSFLTQYPHLASQSASSASSAPTSYLDNDEMSRPDEGRFSGHASPGWPDLAAHPPIAQQQRHSVHHGMPGMQGALPQHPPNLSRPPQGGMPGFPYERQFPQPQQHPNMYAMVSPQHHHLGGPQGYFPQQQMMQYGYPYQPYPSPPLLENRTTQILEESMKEFHGILKMHQEAAIAREKEREAAAEEARKIAEAKAAKEAEEKERATKLAEAATKAREAAEAEAKKKQQELEDKHREALKEVEDARDKERKKARNAMEEVDKLKPDDDSKKPGIVFFDALGRKFTLPWKNVKTWKGMQELIQQMFQNVEAVGDHVMQGHYDLCGPNGDIILPSVWESTVQPEWHIKMHMWIIGDDSSAGMGASGQAEGPKKTNKGKKPSAGLFGGGGGGSKRGRKGRPKSFHATEPPPPPPPLSPVDVYPTSPPLQPSPPSALPAEKKADASRPSAARGKSRRRQSSAPPGGLLGFFIGGSAPARKGKR